MPLVLLVLAGVGTAVAAEVAAGVVATMGDGLALAK